MAQTYLGNLDEQDDLIKVTCQLGSVESIGTLNEIPRHTSYAKNQQPLSDALFPHAVSVRQVESVSNNIPITFELQIGVTFCAEWHNNLPFVVTVHI